MTAKGQLNASQIKLLQTAVRAAGLRDRGQYYLLLRQYKQSDGAPVTSCKQLNRWQFDDLLAICESFGWTYPGRPHDYYRRETMRRSCVASIAQQAAIAKLAGDLGWGDNQLAGMIRRMTLGRALATADLTPGQAHAVIEAIKNMFSRQTGRSFATCRDVQSYTEARDGEKTHQAV